MISKPLKEVKFYSPKKEWGLLGNYSAHNIVVDNEDFPTVEHYFQNRKFWISDPKYAKKIRLAKTPLQASKLGASRDHQIDKFWDELKVKFMESGIEQKILHHLDVRHALLATLGAELLYDSPLDYFWGIGKSGKGNNVVGMIYMNIRNNLLADMGI